MQSQRHERGLQAAETSARSQRSGQPEPRTSSRPLVSWKEAIQQLRLPYTVSTSLRPKGRAPVALVAWLGLRCASRWE